jgi:predicted O-methyltransferase YrrM
MASIRKSLEFVAGVFPSMRRLLAERDSLQRENEALQKNVNTLSAEVQDLRTRVQTGWQQVPGIWQPPGHFYSPIPEVAEVKLDEEEIFAAPPGIRGIDLNEKAQLELLRHFATTYYSEQPFTEKATPGRRYFFENPAYSYSDGLILYCMIRHLRPRRIVEVGSGYSSCVMLDTNELFFNNSIACTFIDPYPQLLRDLIQESDNTHIRILGKQVQQIDDDVFRELEPSDILFIDSSHLAKTGSDVNCLVFKILPLLREGVYVHFHDVFYPFEYPKEWVYEGRAWNEAYLLRAFMQYNRAFQIEFFTSFLIEKHREVFESLMPLSRKCKGANIWLKKTLHDAQLDRAADKSVRAVRPVPGVIEPFRKEHSRFLGEGWHEAEVSHCWMTQTAELTLGGLETKREIAISGFSPLDGTQLTAHIGETPVGKVDLGPPGSFTTKFRVPEGESGRSPMTVRLSVDRLYQAPGDPRKLGLSVTRIEAC